MSLEQERTLDHISLDEVGRGAPYVLGAGQGEHTVVNHGLRTLLTRAADTGGDVAVLVCAGDVSEPTVAHVHAKTTEALFVLDGVVRVLLDDRKGTKIVRDLNEGEFGLLPVGWVHAWAFAAPKTRFIGLMAPGGFEEIVKYLEPGTPPTLEKLRESEKHIDVVWLPDYPLSDDFGDLLVRKP